MTYSPAFSIVLFLLFSCTNSQKENSEENQVLNEVKEIQFSIASYGYVEDLNALSEYINIILTKDSKIYKIKNRYENDLIVLSDTMKLTSINEEQEYTIKNISEKYLIHDEVFGYPNVADAGSLGVTLKLNDGKTVFWELSYRKNELPDDVKGIYEMYENIRKEWEH